jgi:pimeloyl-ACP methyl ester carboxylesterase
MTGRPRTIRRVTLKVVALLMFLVLAGATYQGVATALERRDFPRPGGMVAVGDHQLHIHCIGSGSPTVVLEAPVAGMSAAWASVQPDIARVTRVCAYDRAGLGWSERGDGAYDPARVPDELHTLLNNAGEASPFVMAGHGLGATFARLFAWRFQADTAALILVDVPADIERTAGPGLLTRYAAALPWLARTGSLRLSGGLCALTARLPEPSAGALCAFLNRPDHLSRTADEIAYWNATIALAEGGAMNAPPPTVRIDALGSNRVVFLSPAVAARVSSGILEAVSHTRESAPADRSGATPDER